MLFIFRKLRRSFFLPGKVWTYLAYAFGEILLIVIGILVALQISNWNEHRKARAQETLLLAEIHEEFLYNRAEWDTNLSRYREIYAELDGVYESFPLDLETVDLDELANTLDGAHFRGDYDESTTTIDKLKNTSFDILSDEELRALLLRWEVLAEDHAQVEGMTLDSYLEQFIPTLRGHLKRPYDEGLKDPRSNLEFLTTIEFENLIRDRRTTISNLFRLETEEDDSRNIVKVMDRIIELSKPSE